MRAPYATASLIPACAGAALGLLFQGCTPLSSDPESALSDTPPVRSPAPVPEQDLLVVRQGRYTLVEQGPELAQRNLMRQVVDISIPAGADRTVGEALHYVLIRSGFSLCETQEAAQLYALPLPAAHLQLGPLPLREALKTLAGPAWTLQVDSLARRVCFAPAPTHPTEGQPS
ncbi:PFGI-1 class ICE element type IV pilus protein PilL2 [Pseudomonas sp. Marseille-Q7302]